MSMEFIKEWETENPLVAEGTPNKTTLSPNTNGC